MIDINLYHWVWYLVGLVFIPRITAIIFLMVTFGNILPPWFMITLVLVCFWSNVVFSIRSK